ncbi:hypothetical protein LINPERPRIM_LOCUS24070 [Linum perenne]
MKVGRFDDCFRGNLVLLYSWYEGDCMACMLGCFRD